MEKRKKIVYLLLALLVFGAIFGGGFLRSERRALAKGTMTPDLVIMGDSIFASCRSEDSVGHKIAEALQIEVSDVSFGGTGLCYRDPDGRLSYTGDLFCMSALAQAVVTGDFRVQESARIRQNAEHLAPLWCKALDAEALGLMFLNETEGTMKPLVYVPAAGTLVWENSCASGTTASGAFLAEQQSGADLQRSIQISLKQPGGSLGIRVEKDGKLFLSGTVRLLKKQRTEISF